MNNNRLQQLLEYLKKEPTDPFNLYAVATEYKNSNPNEAIKYFEKLLDMHPSYLPTYYHLAEVYLSQKMINKVESIYLKGIALAKEQKESMALRELQNAYNEFLFDS